MRNLLATVLSLLLAGCAFPTYGPLGEPGHPSTLAQQLVLQTDEPVLAYAPMAMWDKQAYGFQNRDVDAIGLFGPLIFGERSLTFAIWDEKGERYVRAAQIPYSAITEVKLDKSPYSPSGALIVHTPNAYYTFILRKATDPADLYDLLRKKTSR